MTPISDCQLSVLAFQTPPDQDRELLRATLIDVGSQDVEGIIIVVNAEFLAQVPATL